MSTNIPKSPQIALGAEVEVMPPAWLAVCIKNIVYNVNNPPLKSPSIRLHPSYCFTRSAPTNWSLTAPSMAVCPQCTSSEVFTWEQCSYKAVNPLMLQCIACKGSISITQCKIKWVHEFPESNVSAVPRLSLYIKATVLPDKRRGRTGADLVRITAAREEGFYYSSCRPSCFL